MVLAQVAASMVRARKGLWSPAPGRTRPPQWPSSMTLRSASWARDAARAASSEEDEAATAAADNDCALAASRSHCEARSRGPERAPRLSLQHPWLRPQGPWCGDGRPRNILAYDPKVRLCPPPFPFRSCICRRVPMGKLPFPVIPTLRPCSVPFASDKQIGVITSSLASSSSVVKFGLSF